MKGSDKAVVLGVAMAVLLGIFYFAVLSPKRQQASELGKEIDGLKGQLAQQEQTAQFGEQARSEFPVDYGHLVVLGKAVPDQADTPSLLVQLNGIASHNDVQFVGIQLDSSGGGATATPAPTTPPPSSSSSGTSTTSTTSTTPSGSSTSSSSSSSTATPASSTTAPATATEAGVANLPIGATVGPANLGVMPYNLNFTGRFFEVANFIKGLDDLVKTRGNQTVGVDGRLMTIDGFSLSPGAGGSTSDPILNVNVRVTTYVTPSNEGLTAGASPSGPAAPSVGTTPTQPTSAVVTAP
jgi:Tfp pilus assembly protein PilO